MHFIYYLMKILNSTFLIVGAIIGAGFASGKEIFSYFAKFGSISLLILPILFFLFYFFIITYLKLGAKHKNVEVEKINNNLCRPISILNKRINYLNVFMFLTFLILSSAMFSGLVALIKTYFPSLDQILCYGIVLLLTIFLNIVSLKALSIFSSIIVPLIIFGIIICTLFTISVNSVHFPPIKINIALPILTIAYASQNTFLSSFVIIKSGFTLQAKQQKLVANLVSLILCILLALGIICFVLNPHLSEFDMPFAEVSKSINPYFSIMFGIIILGAILTTFISTLSSLKEYFKGNKKYNKSSIMITLIVFLSLFEFGTIIQYLYPIIGIFGVVFCYKAKSSHLPFKPFFKTANNCIHTTCKHTKNNRAG